MQLREGEHMQNQEAIRRGNLKIHELEEDRVQLRKKSLLMDAEIKTLENEIVQACLVKKLIMRRQDTDSDTTTLEDYYREFVTLLPWLQPHLTKQSN